MAQAITVTDIRKNFGAVEALKGVSLDVAEGEKVVVIGPSGSGKSVLIRCINGLEVPDSGTVVVEGMNLSDRKVNARALARDVAMVFQSYNLYPHKTVLENVTLAPIKVLKVPREQAERDGRAYLERVGLSDKVDKYPDQLSGGQQQRVAIARALNMHPKIMLLDEPTSGLDPSGIVEMRAFLQGLNRDKGITIVISSHHLAELEQMATTYAFLKRGCVVEQVSARTLQERCADYVDIAVSDAARFTALLEKELRHERYLVLLDGTVRIFDPAAGIEAYSGLAARAGMDVSKLERRKMSLEQYYLELKEKGVA